MRICLFPVKVLADVLVFGREVVSSLAAPRLALEDADLLAEGVEYGGGKDLTPAADEREKWRADFSAGWLELPYSTVSAVEKTLDEVEGTPDRRSE